jgi:hypothetical protein
MDCIQIPANVKNLAGQRFGRLEVIAYAGSDKHGNATWLCQCTGSGCDSKQVTARGANLKNGHTTSCGCFNREQSTGGPCTHRLGGHRLYKVWHSMINRCTNPKSKDYARYGGRGIAVCETWLGVESGLAQFIADMGATHQDGLQLDRRDNDGPYSKANCRWVTGKQNTRNTHRNRIIEYAGQSRCLAEWTDVLGLRRCTIRDRLARGWPVARALTEGVAPERLAELGLTE